MFKKKFKFWALLIGILLVVSLLLTEGILRITTIVPGYKWELQFDKVDSLVVYDDLIVDSNGIFKLNQEINKKVAHSGETFEQVWGSENLDVLEKYLISSHRQLKPAKRFFPVIWEVAHGLYAYDSCPFLDMIKQMDNSGMFVDSVDFHYCKFLRQPVNSDGFYSIPFRNFKTKKKKILLLGDSFTFGFSATPSYNNFACRLAAKDYAVYNAGIPGTDPAQYCKVAEVYLSKIQPDAVFVCLWAGNDIMISDRLLYPDSFLHFPSNAYWIQGFYNGAYFKNAQDAYIYFTNQSRLPPTGSCLLDGMVDNIAIATKIYLLSDPNVTAHTEKTTYYKDSLSFSQKYIERIDSICASNNIRCEFIVIPALKDLRFSRLKSPPYIVMNKNVHPILDLTQNDFPLDGDDHPSNAGHRKIADFIDSLVVANQKQQNLIN